MQSGLEVLLDGEIDALRGLRVGLCCNHTAVDARFRHAIDRLVEAGVRPSRLFGPEHGIRATAQDMEYVGTPVDPVTGIPTVSLYGSTEASLHPAEETLRDLDVVLFDIQDIGARFYTYQATLAFLMEVAGRCGVAVWVLDRPNPIDGVTLEGNVVRKGYESFVGAYPLAVRHGMTVGELSGYFTRHCGIACEVRVLRCEGWKRTDWYEDTGLPWVYPSPNMPTVDTAAIYPGMCLVEATNLSEGRGTTRPFHLLGAPWLDPQRLVELCERGAADAGLEGVAFRPAAFVPGFQKHARQTCTGIEVHITDRKRLNAFLLGMVTVDAAYRCDPGRFRWRTETYEYVDVPIAIDLLIGNAEYRQAVETGGSLRGLLEAWKPELTGFAQRRAGCLLY